MGELKAACDAEGIATVAFCSQTTSPERMALASTMTTGFLYCISLLGTTGGATRWIRAARLHGTRPANATVPLAVGLGISTPEQCAEASQASDASSWEAP